MIRELSVVLAGKDQEVAKLLEEIRKVKTLPIRLEVAALANLKDTIKKVHPQLVIYNLNGNIEQVRTTAAYVADEFQGLYWGVHAHEADIESVLQFFRMGAVDFLKDPLGPEDARRLVQRVVDLENSRQADSKEEAHRSIALFSTKGGVGLTTIAVNLAVELARKAETGTLLIDSVLQHGNIADLLEVPSQYTIMDVIENFERLDSKLLEHSLAKHKSGLYVLPCPKQPEESEFISSKQAADVFQYFKGIFRYAVADLGHEFTKVAISGLDMADTILLVTTPDVPSLSNTRNALGILKRLGYGPEKVKLVLNRWRMKGEIDFSVIQKNLSLELFHRLPDDWLTCLTAANQGKTVGEISKGAELAKSFEKLASLVTQEFAKKRTAHVAA